ncbi:hypothetical protein PENPOL_c008G03950 [Penicillium polonicum]|uniref:Uncharacterized protein n=1 Tax=Penicillium polonicum TaxID=60169 RepID=A0A1V6NGU5_PENPO|nr:hypothetical protein PENPOL_c008G03950 [Penicillium polonicum]
MTSLVSSNPTSASPAADVHISLLRCPSHVYTGRQDDTHEHRQSKRASTDDTDTQANKRAMTVPSANAPSAQTMRPETWVPPTTDIRHLIGGFSEAIRDMCDKVNNLSARVHAIKNARKFLDTPVARKTERMGSVRDEEQRSAWDLR